MKVQLARDVISRAPGLKLGQGFEGHFKAGQEVPIKIIDYPGKPVAPNTIASLLGKLVEKDWVFWTEPNVDISMIFEAKDIAVLTLTTSERSELSQAPFDIAPFTLLVEE